MTKANRRSFLLVLAIISLACLWLAGSHLLVVPLIESAYRGESLSILNSIISGQAEHPVEYYITIWNHISSSVLLVTLIVGLAVLLTSRPEFRRYVDTRRGRQTALILSILLLLAIFSYFPFVYRSTPGERDGFRMAMGIIDSITSSKPFESPLLYGRNFSFGYYGLLYLFTDLFAANLTLVIPFMNYMNTISSTLMVIPLFLVVRRYWGTSAAVLANLFLMFVPVWWGLSLYGHPMLLAILFMFLGLALIGYRSHLASMKKAPIKLIGVDILIVAAFSLCLTFRLDAILMFPLIMACLLLEGYSLKSTVLRFVVYSFFPVIVFFLLQAQLPGMTVVSGSEHILRNLLKWHSPSRFTPNLVRGTELFVQACHRFLLLAFLASCLYLAYKRKYLSLFFVLPTFLLNYLFWFPNPTPPRHFVYLTPVLAVSIGVWLCLVPWPVRRLAANRQRTAMALAVVFVLVTSLAVLGIRRFSNPYTEKQALNASRFGRDLQQLEPLNKPIFVVADSPPVVVQMQLLSRRHISIRRERRGDIWLLIVNNERNKFTFFTQGWLENDVLKLLRETDEFDDNYLAVDPYNPIVHLDISRSGKDFELLQTSAITN